MDGACGRKMCILGLMSIRMCVCMSVALYTGSYTLFIRLLHLMTLHYRHERVVGAFELNNQTESIRCTNSCILCVQTDGWTDRRTGPLYRFS